MGARTVAGADGRTWSVRRNIEWRPPATGDEFEHDVDGGRGAIVLILSALVLFWVVLFLWAPSQVHVPWYMVLLGLGVLLFFPIRWVMRRPWSEIEPFCACDSPAMERSNVVLPQPEGPSSTCISPSSMSRLMSRSTGVAP